MYFRALYLVETWNPVSNEVETLIFWSGLSLQELKTHAGDNLLVITGILKLTSTEVRRDITDS